MDWLPALLIGGLLLFLLSKMFPVKGLKNLTASEVAQLLKEPNRHLFIDVREPFEYKRGHIKGFRNIPLGQLPAHLQEIGSDQSVVLTCQSGMRSRQAAKLLLKHGVKQVGHLAAGVSGWNREN